MTPRANLMVVGIGGQGVMTACDVLAGAALAAGLDVSKTEAAGMSQRGGIVSSQLRVGPRVLAAEITPGEVDVLIALEAAEALRWCHWLAPGGCVVTDALRVVPPVVSAGLERYPRDPWAELCSADVRARRVDAGAIARTLGDPRLANTVMLGASADLMPWPASRLLAQVLVRFGADERLRALNARAFEAGCAAAAAASCDAPAQGSVGHSTSLA